MRPLMDDFAIPAHPHLLPPSLPTAGTAGALCFIAVLDRPGASTQLDPANFLPIPCPFVPVRAPIVGTAPPLFLHSWHP
jgi:hypothetical protein